MNRALTVAAWVLLSVVCNGLQYGTADHGIHFVFIDRTIAPATFAWAGDLLDVAAARHPSVLWEGVGWLVGPLGWRGAVVGLHLLGLAATGWLLHALIEETWEGPAAPAIGLLLAAPAHVALGGPATLEPQLLPRGLAMPLELGALLLLIRGRRRLAFGLAGVAVLLHAPSAMAALAGLAGADLLLRGDLRRTLGGVGWAAAGASPLVWSWVAAGGAGSSLTRVDDAWWQLLAVRLPHHLLPATWPLSAWLGVAAWLVLGAAATRVARATPRAVLIGFGAGVLGWALLGGSMLGPQLRWALALQLEPWQGTRLLVLVSAAAIGAALGRAPAIGSRLAPAATPAVLLSAALAVALLGVPGRERRPSWWLDGEPGEERDVAVWLRQQTPPQSFIAVPPDGFATARVHAARPLGATWKEGGEALFDREIAMRWRARVELGCACVPWAGEPGIAPLRRRIRAGLRRADAGQLAASAAASGADYLVLRRDTPGVRPSTPLFTTEGFEVFSLSER